MVFTFACWLVAAVRWPAPNILLSVAWLASLQLGTLHQAFDMPACGDTASFMTQGVLSVLRVCES